MVFVMLFTLYWYIAGIFVTGESDVLSARVKRELPQSTLGRVFFTWFAPGSGTGYVFIIANMLTLSLIVSLPYDEIRNIVIHLHGDSIGRVGPSRASVQPSAIFQSMLLATSYVAIYLGLGRLIFLAIGRFTPVRVIMRLLVHVLLILVGCAIP